MANHWVNLVLIPCTEGEFHPDAIDLHGSNGSSKLCFHITEGHLSSFKKYSYVFFFPSYECFFSSSVLWLLSDSFPNCLQRTSSGKGDHDFLKYLFKEDVSIVLCNPVQLLSRGPSPRQSWISLTQSHWRIFFFFWQIYLTVLIPNTFLLQCSRF